jgi:eukaryotic-like serine/threonine-protein kinase
VLEPGSIFIGKYTIERVLGAGGMGTVFAATHIDLADRVAIKVLNSEMTGRADVVDRFLREARASVRLKGEHVARIFDVGRTPEGDPYMVMEYLDGADLLTMFRERGAMPYGEVVDYVLQTCEAMAEAHAQSIVHRDIKPANLFISSRPDGSPIVKVLDFGISKALDRDLHLTNSQAMLGTPAYMSPEQLRTSRDVDTRTDVWSLGVVMYELVSGQHPFDADNFGDLVIRVVTQPAPPLGVALPQGLAAAIQTCLERDVERRFRTVGELAAAIAPFASSRSAGASAAARSASILRRAGMSGPQAMPAVLAQSHEVTTEMTSNGAVHAALSVDMRARSGIRRAWIAAGFAMAVVAAIAVVALTQRHDTPSAIEPSASTTDATAVAQPIAIDAAAPDAATAAAVVPVDAAPPDAARVTPAEPASHVKHPPHRPSRRLQGSDDDALRTRM